jgi:hypothetical protein
VLALIPTILWRKKQFDINVNRNALLTYIGAVDTPGITTDLYCCDIMENCCIHLEKTETS